MLEGGQLGRYPLIAKSYYTLTLYTGVIKSKLKSLLSWTFWKTAVETNAGGRGLCRNLVTGLEIKIFIFVIFMEILEFLWGFPKDFQRQKYWLYIFYQIWKLLVVSVQKETTICHPNKICRYLLLFFVHSFPQLFLSRILSRFCLVSEGRNFWRNQKKKTGGSGHFKQNCLMLLL